MKVINLYLDVFNKKELPKTIKVHGETFELTEDWGENSWYRNIVNRKGIEESINRSLEFVLNLEVEIIEEKQKKIDELSIKDNCLKDERGYYCSLNKHTKVIAMKLNEVIETLNCLLEKSEDNG